MSITSVRSLTSALARGLVVPALFAFAIVVAPHSAFAATTNVNTVTVITSDTPDPSNVGQSYTVNVTVTASSSRPSVGSVTVADGNGATCTDNSGSNSGSNSSTFSCALTSTTSGSKTLTASYAGGSVTFGSNTTHYNASSGTASHTVNTPADTTAPTVSMTAPADSTTVSGASVSLTANATDNVGVAGVTFKLDTNTIIGSEDTSAPYGVTWDTTSVSNGTHTLVAVARDAAGNIATSSAITVTVNNAIPNPACTLDASNDLINNPCLETGSTWNGTTGGPTNWFFYSAGVTATATYPAAISHSGTGAASVTVTAVTAPSGEHDAQWGFDPVTVSADTNYQFSFWYNSSVDTEVDAEYDTTGGASYGQVRSNLPSTGGTWKQFTTNIVTPKGTTALSITALLTQPGTITVDDYQLQKMADPNAFTTGMVTLTFDDGLASFWQNATSTLNAAGIKATSYVITGPNGSNVTTDTPNGGYLSKAQIQALYAAGYDIGDHTTSHVYLTDPSTNLTTEINNSVSDLSTALGATVKTMAYPYGAYNTAVETQVKNVPLSIGRSVDDGYNDKATDPYALRIKEIYDTTSIAQVESWIDDANTNHEWLILLMHDVQPTCPAVAGSSTECITIANLQTIANYLNSSHTSTVTMSQGVAAMSGADITAPVITISSPANGSTISTATTTISGTTDDTAVVHVGLNGKFYTATPSAGVWSVAMADADALPNGTHTITASSTDASGNTGNATASFTVAVVANVAPVATDLSVSTLANTATSSTLTATDANAGDTLTFATTTDPAHGTLTLNNTTGAFTYTPATNYAGSDSFSFKANDGKLDSNTATVHITVSAAPDVTAPVISSISAGTPAQDSATITWTTNEGATTQVYYGPTSSNYNASTSLDTNLVTSHSQALSGLSANTTYHFIVVSFDAAHNTATSSDQTFTTAAASSGNTGGSGGGSSTTNTNVGGGGGGGGGTVVGLIGAVNTNPTGGQVLGASTGGLSETQINAILNLLRSFNADASVITNVANALHGAPTGTGSTKFIFTKTLQVGSTGGDVTQLQSRLTLEGDYSGPITGYFGPLTKAAVMKYQAAHHLPQVGIVGPLTRAALNQ